MLSGTLCHCYCVKYSLYSNSCFKIFLSLIIIIKALQTYKTVAFELNYRQRTVKSIPLFL